MTDPVIAEMVAWFRKESTRLQGQAYSRRHDEKALRHSTLADRTAALAIAQRMAGRKMRPDLSATAADQVADRHKAIADRLETEAYRLSYWADHLERLNNGDGA